MIVDMNSFFGQDPSFLKDMNPDEEIGGYKTAEQLKFNASRRETQDITLTTEEGDIINVSSLSELKTSYLSFDYSAQLKDKSLALEAEKFNMTSKNAFSISVEGDLNEDEKEDIAKVLSQLDNIMEDLVSGDLDEVMKGALGLIDGTDTITSIDAVLQFRRQVSMEHRTMTQVSGNGGLPHHLPHPPGEGNGNGQMMSASNLIAKISNQLMEIIQESSMDNEELKGPVNDLFAKFMDKFSLDPQNQENQLKSQFLEQLQSNLNNLLEA
ncbi:MAG: hypothetical protein GY940_01460 [bacterium]|nr:hypothetical protein [bacterium]